MWGTLNHLIFAAEVLLLIWGVYLLSRKNNVTKTFIYAIFVFILNIALYGVPFFYAREVLHSEESMLFGLLNCVSATIKQFVGEVKTEAVTQYSTVFPKYIHIFGIGAGLAVMTSFFAAISVFGRRFINSIRIMWKTGRFSGGSCDVVFGSDEGACLYAKKRKNTILVVDETKKEAALNLMESGFTVIKKKFSVVFLKSRFFSKAKTYNMIFLNDKGDFLENINIIISYFKSQSKKKNIYFYVEADERFIETAQNKIARLSEMSAKKEKQFYQGKINFFSRNELLARKLVEANPITKYMPDAFFCEDRSIKADKKINVFMLGITTLSREIYKQFVINNQLVKFEDGTYKGFPVSYYVFDENVSDNDWCFGGLKKALSGLEQNKDEYFELPDMPYNVQCVNKKPLCVDLDNISKIIKEKDTLSYVFIDTGDQCENMEISSKLQLLLDTHRHHRLFVCDTASVAEGGINVTAYGNTDEIFNHDVIVDESLVELAKRINKNYLSKQKKYEAYSHAALNEVNEDDWVKKSYFNKCSNISLANNLRLKLNLLGCDYKKDGRGCNIELLKENEISADTPYEENLKQGLRSSLLAQEHGRWNAYHLMNGYLPMKKSKLDVTQKTQNQINGDDNIDKSNISKMDIIKVTNKNNLFKKHICLTSYAGLSTLSETLSELAKTAAPHYDYTKEDFDYYKNDGMIFDIIYDFFKDSKYSVIKKDEIL